eukprot:scaffold276552_cov43-Prasinocladus_malaysianus.AAC.1
MSQHGKKDQLDCQISAGRVLMPLILVLFHARWANSALVVGVIPEDWQPWHDEWGPLAGMKLQQAVEVRAAKMGGGGL